MPKEYTYMINESDSPPIRMTCLSMHLGHGLLKSSSSENLSAPSLGNNMRGECLCDLSGLLNRDMRY